MLLTKRADVTQYKFVLPRIMICEFANIYKKIKNTEKLFELNHDARTNITFTCKVKINWISKAKVLYIFLNYFSRLCGSSSNTF